MASSYINVSPVTAVAALVLCCAAQTILASPLPPSFTDLEQELDSLNPQSQSQPSSVQNPFSPGETLPFHSRQDNIQDVLQDDQDVAENQESVLGRNPSLQDRQDPRQTDDVSPVENLAKLSSQTPADVDDPFQNGERAKEHVLQKVDNHKEDHEQKFQNLNKMTGNDQENQLQELPLVKDLGQKEDVQEVSSSFKDGEKVHLQDPNISKGGRQEEQDLNPDNSQEEELQTLQVDNDDVDDDDEEEAEDLERSFLPENKEELENEAAAQELDSMIRYDNSRASDVYYDSYDSENDDDNDDVDGDGEPDLNVAKGGIPDELSPGESSHAGEASNNVDNQETPHFKSLWKTEDIDRPRHDWDDANAAEGMRGVEMKRGQDKEVVGEEEEEGEGEGEEEEEGEGEGEEEEEGRFRPVRVVVLNETLYLNSSQDDRLPRFQPVPLPVHFKDYDVNRDGMISLPELRYVSRATEGVRQAFRAADSDGDGWIDRGEFQVAGWGRPVYINYGPPPPPPPPQMTRGHPYPPSPSS
ncbi:hypothetical protein ACOMHN_039697 [Nucella lapillus]